MNDEIEMDEELKARRETEEAKKKAEEFDRKFKELERKLAVARTASDAVNILEMPKETAQRYAEAVTDGNQELASAILRQHMKAFKAKMMQDFLKSRGEINARHGDSGESKAVRLAKSLPIYNNEVDDDILKAYI